MRIPFLFWNLKALPLQDRIAELAVEHQLQVIVLAECVIEPAKIIGALAAVGLRGFTHLSSPAGLDSDLRIFKRAPGSPLKLLFEDDNHHVVIHRFLPKGSPEILLVVVHAQSKLWWPDPSDREHVGTKLGDSIREYEKVRRHGRTVLVGDLNMNPFESPVFGFNGLHAVMTKQIAKAGGRTVDKVHRPFFYNPMWRFFGERADGPPGTYYYRAGAPTSLYWNIYDQVMVRPELMDQLTDVKILHRVGVTSLLDGDGQPDLGVGSDHLPLRAIASSPLHVPGAGGKQV